MQTIQSSEGQTLVDIAIEYCGDASKAMDIAILNGFDIDDVTIGQTLQVPDFVIDKKAIVASLADGNIVPASAIEVNEHADEWEQYYNEGLPESHE